LTGAKDQISVDVSSASKMSAFDKRGWPNSLSMWQVFTCILLAGLLLYNPFLAVSTNSGALAICHPASYRATVASCELEQFVQPNVSFAALLPNLTDLQILLPRLAAAHSTLMPFPEERITAVPQTGFSSSLWFRPPPVA
jgi:hypothetical protein